MRIEEPVKTTYKGIDVYKLTTWTQGPAMLQALNILEPLDLKGMGLNSARYIHTIYQAMNLAFADRDFYYGDPYFPPEEPVRGLLSKEYAEARRQADRLGAERPGGQAGRPLSVPGRDEPVPRAAGEVGERRAAAKSWTQPRPGRGAARPATHPTRPSAPARPRSSPPTRRAGWSR